MANLIKTIDTENFQYRIRFWPTNTMPYVITRLDKIKATHSKTAIRDPEIASFDTLEDAETYIKTLK